MSLMTLSEIRDLLEGTDDTTLFSRADAVRSASFGNEVHLRGIVEFSNCCIKDCLYCGLRKSNPTISRYRLTKDEIVLTASLVPELGIRTVVLQSGDDFWYGKKYVGQIIQEIKSLYDVAITLSLGDRREDEYRYWRDCGADRYLLKIETFGKKLHERVRPGQRLGLRLERLLLLKNLGYEVGSGIIVGLPGMDTKLLATDISALTELELDMIAVGPFIPHPASPLGNEPAGDLLLSFRTLAILRLLNPWANIPATSALGALADNGKARALRCGANVVMVSITPESVRASYDIYPGKNTTLLHAREEVAAAKSLIHACQLIPSRSNGS
ncbi:MAG: [FeFe] hydrogenase H-cluster radical SAM maturase HydE [Thermodesulfobacteriota bacterium]